MHESLGRSNLFKSISVTRKMREWGSGLIPGDIVVYQGSKPDGRYTGHTGVVIATDDEPYDAGIDYGELGVVGYLPVDDLTMYDTTKASNVDKYIEYRRSRLEQQTLGVSLT